MLKRASCLTSAMSASLCRFQEPANRAKGPERGRSAGSARRREGGESAGRRQRPLAPPLVDPADQGGEAQTLVRRQRLERGPELRLQGQRGRVAAQRNRTLVQQPAQDSRLAPSSTRAAFSSRAAARDFSLLVRPKAT